eukprot:6008141-Pyramimonas_sp.AAC.1
MVMVVENKPITPGSHGWRQQAPRIQSARIVRMRGKDVQRALEGHADTLRAGAWPADAAKDGPKGQGCK